MNTPYSTTYYRANKDKYKGYREKQKAQNPNFAKEKAAAWRLTHPEYKRNESLKRRYGVTVAQYEVMFAEQCGCCAICARHQTGFSQRLAVDHNHKTGKVRGLLCGGCNAWLAAIEDKEFQKKAFAYLQRVEK